MIDRRNGSPLRAPVFRGRPRVRVGGAGRALALAMVAVWAVGEPSRGQGEREEQEQEQVRQVREAFDERNYDSVIERTEDLGENATLRRLRAAAFQRRGERRFFHADIDGAIRDFTAFLAIYPDRKPNHWQRGLAYYYAGNYKKGKAQFERHQAVNSQDVENAVWHFLCSVRESGGSVERAREGLIPIERDSRVPMAEVHDLFAGKGDAGAVLEAASPDDDDELSEVERNHLCYAHFYLGLYYEAVGNTEKMEDHIRRAAFDYAMDHYMGRTARLHAELRGIRAERSENE